MLTEEVNIRNDGAEVELALGVVDSFIRSLGITGRDAMHLRLISEEAIGMIRAVAGDYDAVFRISGDDKECVVNLTSKVRMDPQKRKEFLSVSTSGRNESARGIVGKIRELIEIGMENYENVCGLSIPSGSKPVSYGMMGMEKSVLEWSLDRYRRSVSVSIDESEAYQQAWDELEKSVIANIADNVLVGIMNDMLEISIYKGIGKTKAS